MNNSYIYKMDIQNKKIREETCGNCPYTRRKNREPQLCAWHPEDLCKGSCDNIGLTQEYINKLDELNFRSR